MMFKIERFEVYFRLCGWQQAGQPSGPAILEGFGLAEGTRRRGWGMLYIDIIASKNGSASGYVIAWKNGNASEPAIRCFLFQRMAGANYSEARREIPF
jgi:hypothetical protein